MVNRMFPNTNNTINESRVLAENGTCFEGLYPKIHAPHRNK